MNNVSHFFSLLSLIEKSITSFFAYGFVIPLDQKGFPIIFYGNKLFSKSDCKFEVGIWSDPIKLLVILGNSNIASMQEHFFNR